MRAFGAELKDLRRARGVGIRVLSRAVGCSHGYLSKLESGRASAPSEELIDALATELNGDVDRLYCAAGRLPSGVARYILARPDYLARLRAAASK